MIFADNRRPDAAGDGTLEALGASIENRQTVPSWLLFAGGLALVVMALDPKYWRHYRDRDARRYRGRR